VVPLQPALWLIGAGAGKPTFVEEVVEIVLLEGLAVPDSEEILDFAGLAGCSQYCRTCAATWPVTGLHQARKTKTGRLGYDRVFGSQPGRVGSW
jgi:hypothetical protein